MAGRNWGLRVLVAACLVALAMGACPNKCSGHGRCGASDVCECMQNWMFSDCSGRVCPFTRAWHDVPTADNEAHEYAECGNRGVCDRSKGVCNCDAGFAGSGCRRMACPNGCSGHGGCGFMEDEASALSYTLWDQEKIMTCRCDPGWGGHDCTKRLCPRGDDPLTADHVEMVQAIVVNAASVQGYLSYKDPYGGTYTTSAIMFDATAQATTCTAVQTALNRLPNNVLNSVTVAPSASYYTFARSSPTSDTGAITGPTASSATVTVCLVSFKSEPGTSGYQNLLGCHVAPHATAGHQPLVAGSATATCTVEEVAPGAAATAVSATRVLSEIAECSNRGLCDYSTGICKCFAGHMGLACQRQEALV